MQHVLRLHSWTGAPTCKTTLVPDATGFVTPASRTERASTCHHDSVAACHQLASVWPHNTGSVPSFIKLWHASACDCQNAVSLSWRRWPRARACRWAGPAPPAAGSSARAPRQRCMSWAGPARRCRPPAVHLRPIGAFAGGALEVKSSADLCLAHRLLLAGTRGTLPRTD